MMEKTGQAYFQEELMSTLWKSVGAFIGSAALMVPILALAGADLPEAEEESFLTYVTTTNPYQEWGMWPGKGKLYQGTEPHGALLTTYVNEIAEQAVMEQAQAEGMPEGSIIVKENYTPDKQLAAVTAMYKKKGYHPEAGDWFWIKYEPSGEVEASGKVDGCIQCHEKARGRDYTFTGSR
jgi:hypothetical protein